MRFRIIPARLDGDPVFLRMPRRKFGDPHIRARRSDGTAFTQVPLQVRVAKFRRHK